MKESGLTCGSHVRLTCSILLDLVIYKMSKLKTSLHNNFSNNLFHMGRNVTFHAVLCSCTWIVHVKLGTVGLQWHKMNRKCPEHASSSLLTTAAEKKQTSHRLLFLFFLVFSPHDMNVFVTDFIVDNIATHVQGFSSRILIISFEKLSQMWRNLD